MSRSTNRFAPRRPARFRVWLAMLALVLGVALLPDAGLQAAPQERDAVEMLFFWAVGCPHCEQAKPFVDELEKANPEVDFSRYEVTVDPEGRRRFTEKVRELDIKRPSVPAFVCGKRYVIGFKMGKTEAPVRDMLKACQDDAAEDGDRPAMVARQP